MSHQFSAPHFEISQIIMLSLTFKELPGFEWYEQQKLERMCEKSVNTKYLMNSKCLFELTH